MNADEILKLQREYGMNNVLTTILVMFFIGVFFFMLRWVVRMNNEMREASHEEKMALTLVVNNGLKAISEALSQNTQVCQEIIRNIKDGFDILRRDDDKYRDELTGRIKDIKSSIDENRFKEK